MGWSGFGDANPPLDPTVSVFENGNPPPTDWTFGSGRNRVVVGRFGRVVGLWSGLDSPTNEYEAKEDRMKRYLTLSNKLVTNFDDVKIT